MDFAMRFGVLCAVALGGGGALAACSPGDGRPPTAQLDVRNVPPGHGSPRDTDAGSDETRVRLPPIGASDTLAAEGRAYAARDELPAALDRFENAYRISPSDEVLYDIGRTLERMGRRREAADVYEKLLQGDLSSTDRMSMEVRIRQLRGDGS